MQSAAWCGCTEAGSTGGYYDTTTRYAAIKETGHTGSCSHAPDTITGTGCYTYSTTEGTCRKTIHPVLTSADPDYTDTGSGFAINRTCSSDRGCWRTCKCCPHGIADSTGSYLEFDIGTERTGIDTN
ncbi:hypothetical protein D3C80_1668110 [compost metagenome]